MAPPGNRKKPYQRVYPVNSDPSLTATWARTTQQNRQFIWFTWNNNRRNNDPPLQRVDPPPEFNLGVTYRPPFNKLTNTRPSSDSITYDSWRSNVRATEPQSRPRIEQLFQNQLNQQAAREEHLLNTIEANTISPEEQQEVNDILAQFQSNGGSISSADFDNADGAGGSGVTPATQEESPPTEATNDQQLVLYEPNGDTVMSEPTNSAQPPSKRKRGEVGGSDGGFDNASGPISSLPKGGYRAAGGLLTYTKCHTMKSWGVPYINVPVSTLRGGANCVTTPLMYIPWEYACFYLSYDEFKLVPAGSYVDSVSISVMQTVAQTGYPTGGTTASVATTNHPKVLCVGKDLDAKCRGGINRRLVLSSNMIPSLATDPSVDGFLTDFVSKQYGTDQTVAAANIVVPGCAHRIPFVNTCHYLIYQPNRAQAIARGFFTDTAGVITDNSSPGYEFFQNYITEVNATDTTWSPIDTMTYKFESAPIGARFEPLEIYTNDFIQATGNSAYYNNKRGVKNVSPNLYLEIAETFVSSTEQDVKLVTYKSAPMEKGAYYGTGDAAGKPARQPSYHIGLRAIDKNDPTNTSSRSSQFVQANISFEITATMTIRTPPYPNRFTLPKFYNVSLENAPQTVSGAPEYVDPVVTFGLIHETPTPPPADSVDAREGNSRPRRDLPRVV
jgi:hypothetical protein